MSMGPHGSRVLAFFILLIVALWAGLAYIGARTGAEATLGSGLSIKHSQNGNMHTYSGVVPVPACNELAAGLTSVGVDPAHLTLMLSVAQLSTCTGGSPSVQDFTLAYGAASDSPPLLVEVLLNDRSASFKVAE